MELTANDRHWYDLICQCRESGFTDKQWCMEHGIHVSTFYRHARALKKKSCDIPNGCNGRKWASLQDVVPLQIIPEPPAMKSGICSGDMLMPGEPQASSNVSLYNKEGTEPGFMPAMQIRFSNGSCLAVSNSADPLLLNSAIQALASA